MAADRIPVVDGPAEGSEVSPGDTFQWLEVVTLKRGESSRGPGAGLYELRDGAYRYIGGAKSRCDSCGGYYVRAEGGAKRQPCPLCGQAVT